MEKVKDFFKKLLVTVLNFTTGLGFYGLGLLGISIFFLFIGFGPLGWGFLGAFIFRNYAAIVEHLKKIF